MYVKKVGGSASLGSGDDITFAYALFTQDYNRYFRGDTRSTSLDAYIASGAALAETELVFMLQCWRVGTVFNDFKFQIEVVEGTTAPTTYAHYTGQTATMTLPHTIYGGEVDAVTGEGQETWKLLDDFDSYNYNKGGEEAGWVQSDAAVAWCVYDSDLIPNRQKIVANVFLTTKKDIVTDVTPYSIGSGNGFIAFRLPRSVAATKDDVRNWLKEHNAQIAFEVKSPTPIVSTGAPQPIPALSGVNTVLTDADSVTVTGRADPIKRITDLEDAVASMTNT